VASFNIYEAKTQLSKLLRRVRAGQEVIIADAGTPIAKLVPIESPKVARTLGADRGKIGIAPDAFDPLTEEELALWHGPVFPATPAPPAPPASPASGPQRSRQPAAARPSRRRPRRGRR
jgi:prevent-host-death family protein